MGSSGTIREAGDDHLQDGPPSLVSTHPKDEVHRRLWQPAHTHHPSTSFWVHPVLRPRLTFRAPGAILPGSDIVSAGGTGCPDFSRCGHDAALAWLRHG